MYKADEIERSKDSKFYSCSISRIAKSGEPPNTSRRSCITVIGADLDECLRRTLVVCDALNEAQL